MDKLPTFEESVRYYKSHDIYWESFLGGLMEMREKVIADMKRNLETPNVTDRAYLDSQLIAKLSAVDDLTYELNAVEIETE